MQTDTPDTPDSPDRPDTPDTANTQPPAEQATGEHTDGTEAIGTPTVSTGPKKRRRGSRGGKNRRKPAGPRPADGASSDGEGAA